MLIKSNKNGFGRDSFCRTLITAEEVISPGLAQTYFIESSKYQKKCELLISGGSIYPAQIFKIAKFGTHSYYFNEYNINYISISTASDIDYLLADDEYTIDCWIYANTNSGRAPSDASHIFGWYVDRTTYNTCRLYYDGSDLYLIYEIIEGGVTIVTISYNFNSYVGLWTHIAVTRNNDTDYIYLYVNGVLIGSDSITATLSTYRSALLVGNMFTTSYSPISLYMDEFRFSKGISRYVNSNFIVPNRAY